MASSKKKKNSNAKWAGKAHKVDLGDLVQFRSPNQNMTGSVGVVVGYLDKKTILVRTFGGADTDFAPMYLSLGVREPNSSYCDANGDNVGHNKWYYGFFIQKVVHRVNPAPKKKKVRAPLKFYEVTPEVLPEVLNGTHEVPRGHHVVLVPDTIAELDQEVTP